MTGNLGKLKNHKYHTPKTPLEWEKWGDIDESVIMGQNLEFSW